MTVKELCERLEAFNDGWTVVQVTFGRSESTHAIRSDNPKHRSPNMFVNVTESLGMSINLKLEPIRKGSDDA